LLGEQIEARRAQLLPTVEHHRSPGFLRDNLKVDGVVTLAAVAGVAVEGDHVNSAAASLLRRLTCSRHDLAICQKVGEYRPELIAERWIAIGRRAARCPIIDIIGEHDFIPSAFNAKLELTRRANNQRQGFPHPLPHLDRELLYTLAHF